MFFAQHELKKPKYFTYSGFDEYRDFQEILDNENLIVYFSASWCPPCKIMTKNFNEFVYIKDDDIFLHKVEETQENTLINKFKIKVYPTIMYFKNAKIVKIKEGVASAKELQANSKTYFR